MDVCHYRYRISSYGHIVAYVCNVYRSNSIAFLNDLYKYKRNKCIPKFVFFCRFQHWWSRPTFSDGNWDAKSTYTTSTRFTYVWYGLTHVLPNLCVVPRLCIKVPQKLQGWAVSQNHDHWDGRPPSCLTFLVCFIQNVCRQSQCFENIKTTYVAAVASATEVIPHRRKMTL